MNLKQFKYALVLAEEGSFSRAADVLNITQPSLSQYIKKIENQIGMPIFDRLNGEVRLTDAGRVYIDAGKKILDLEHQMHGRFNDLAQHKCGSITVGTSPYRAASMMPGAVEKFIEKYPGMQVIVEEMTTSELMDASEHGQFDFCVTLLPVDERVFAYETIAQEELLLAVPREFVLFETVDIKERKYPAIDARLLDKQSFVMITESQIMQRELNNLCIDCNLTLRKSAVVKSLEAQISMVRAGVGMALVPSGIERFCPENEVKYYSFVQNLPVRQVVAIWRKECILSDVAKEFIQIMKTVL